MTDIFRSSPNFYLHAAFAWTVASSSLSTTVVAITCEEEALHKEVCLDTCIGGKADRPLPHTFAAKKVLCIQLDLSGLEKCVACITRLQKGTHVFVVVWGPCRANTYSILQGHLFQT